MVGHNWRHLHPFSHPSRLARFLSNDASILNSNGGAGVTSYGPVTSAYQNLVKSGSIRSDHNQLTVASHLDALHKSLYKTESYALNSDQLHFQINASHLRSATNSSLSSFERYGTFLAHEVRRRILRVFQPDHPRGLYVHGSVGSGKSFLMDLFYNTTIDTSDRIFTSQTRVSRRVHFHEFMLDVHSRIHAFKQRSPRDDPIPPVALDLARESRLLCFDEFQVTDIADAMIMKRLFEMLWEMGVVTVSTSNRSPDELYEGGLNRSVFLPFIATLKGQCDVLAMESEWDYRRENNNNNTPIRSKSNYLWPSDNAGTREALEEIFKNGGGKPRREIIPVMMGRTIEILRANDQVAWFDFAELCNQPLGAADYIALCQRFPVVIIDNVPQLGANFYNEARRFVTLIDALYEARTRLVLSAEVALDDLFVGFEATAVSNDGDEEMWVSGEGGSSSSNSTTMIRNKDGENVEWSATGRIGVSLAQLSAVQDVSFSFRRAESRLVEMNGEKWRQLATDSI